MTVIFPTYNGRLTSVEGLERGESSKGRKRAREAIRYASRTPEEIQARRERVRARRQNLTPKEKEEINARRREKRQRMTLDERNASQRARRQSLTPEERQETNARQRARRQSLPPEDRRVLLAQRNASYAARRDTPCMDSIVLKCPAGSFVGHPSSNSYAFSCSSTRTPTFCAIQGNLEMEDDHIFSSSKGSTNTAHGKETTSLQCPTSPSMNRSSLAHDGSICPGSPTIIFNVDDDNSQMIEQEDDEYFAFAVDILKDNPYSETFRSLGGVDDLEEYPIELNTDMRLDQRRYNLPISSEVAAVWVEGNELCKHFERSIVLFGNDNKRYSVQPYYGCYDPLSYPLFFPRGEIGWHPGIPKNGVSLKEILQSRRGGRHKPGTETPKPFP